MLNEKNDSIWNKKLLLKIYRVENDRKKESFLQKNFVQIKDDRDSVTRPKMKIEKNEKIELG